MKRFYWLALALVPALALSQAQGPFGIFGGPIPSANLAPATQVPANTYAFTSDIGLVMDNGTAWVAAGGGGGASDFGSITSGTNTTATMICGTGCSISSGGGVVAATTAEQASGTPTTCTGGQAAAGIDSSFNATGCFTPAGSGTVNSATTGQVTYYGATGTAVSGSSAMIVGATSLAAGVPIGLKGYATASLPACSTPSIAYTTDGTPSLAFCNGTNWVNTGGTAFTVVGTGCTPTGATGDATGGAFTLAAGPCTAVTIAFNGAVGMTAGHLWVCSVTDFTAQQAGTWIPAWGESGEPSTATVTIPIPGAAAATDVIHFSCTPH